MKTIVNTTNNLTITIQQLVDTFGMNVVMFELGKVSIMPEYLGRTNNRPTIAIGQDSPVLTNPNHEHFGKYAVGDTMYYEEYCNAQVDTSFSYNTDKGDLCDEIPKELK